MYGKCSQDGCENHPEEISDTFPEPSGRRFLAQFREQFMTSYRQSKKIKTQMSISCVRKLELDISFAFQLPESLDGAVCILRVLFAEAKVNGSSLAVPHRQLK